MTRRDTAFSPSGNRRGRTACGAIAVLAVVALAPLAATAQCSSASGQLLGNCDFELPALADGDMETSSAAVPDWTLSGSASVFNPTTAVISAGNEPSPPQVAAIGETGQNGSFCQQVTASMASGETYTFSGEAGQRNSGDGLPTSWRLFLRRTTGGSTIRCTNTAAPAPDTFVPVSCTFMTAAADVGNALEACVETNSADGQVLFDEAEATRSTTAASVCAASSQPQCAGSTPAIWVDTSVSPSEICTGVGTPAGAYAGTLNGAAGGEVIAGTCAADTLDGGGGNDTLCGFGEDDTLRGDVDDDLLCGSGGNDSLFGEAGDVDQLDGGVGADANDGGAGVVDNCINPSGGTDCEVSIAFSDCEESADLSLEMVEINSTVAAGDTNVVQYRITVTNNGNVPVCGATVTDNFPAAITAASWDCTPSGSSSCVSGNIPPAATTSSGAGNINELVDLGPNGGSVTYEVEVDIDDCPPGNSMTNTATVTEPAATSDPGPSANSDSETTEIDFVADLEISKSDAPDPVTAGNTVTYTITVTNNGPACADNVVVTDTLPDVPSEMDNIVAPGFCAVSGNTVTCNLGTVVPGNTSFNISGDTNPALADGTVLTNEVEVSTDTPETSNGTTPQTESTTEDTTVNNPPCDANSRPSCAGVAATVWFDQDAGMMCGSIGAGADVIAGTCGSDTFDGLAGDDRICGFGGNDTLSGSAGDDTLCGQGDDDTLSGGTEDDDLDGGAGTDTLDGGTETFGGEDRCREGETNINCERPPPPVPDFGCDPSANLDVDKQGPSAAVPGTSITYTIVITNTGMVPVCGAQVTDNFPSELDNVMWSCSASAESSCGSGSGSGDINELVNLGPNGGFVTFDVTADVLPCETGTLSNTATATLPAGFSGSNGSDTLNIPLTPQADLEIVKFDDLEILEPEFNDPVLVCTRLRYFISVTNQGPSCAQNVEVEDVLPQEFQFLSENLESGNFLSCSGDGGSPETVTCDLGTLAPDPDPGTFFYLEVLETDFTAKGLTVTNSVTVTSDATSVDTDGDGDTDSFEEDTDIRQSDPYKLTVSAAPRFLRTDGTDTVEYLTKLHSLCDPLLSTTGVTLTTTLPSDVTLLSSNPTADSQSGNTLTYNVGNMTGGDTFQVVQTAELATSAEPGDDLPFLASSIDDLGQEASASFLGGVRGGTATISVGDVILRFTTVTGIPTGGRLQSTVAVDNTMRTDIQDVVLTLEGPEEAPVFSTFPDPTSITTVSGRTTVRWDFPTVPGPGKARVKINHLIPEDLAGTVMSFTATAEDADGRVRTETRTIQVRQ